MANDMSKCDSCHKRKTPLYDADFVNEKLGRQALKLTLLVCVECGNRLFKGENWRPS